MHEFLIQGFNFVNKNTNWNAITKLADYILASNNSLISCEEAAAVLDAKQGN